MRYLHMRYLPLWEWEEEGRDEGEREGKEGGRKGGREGETRCFVYLCSCEVVNSYHANIVITLTSCVETEIEDDLLQTPVIFLVDKHNIVT